MSECVLKLDNISYGYDNTRKILDNVTYEFNKNVMYSIVGPSGSGKTTLLSLIGALDEPKEGNILYNNKGLKKIGYTKYRRMISFVFQSYNLINYMTGIENVITGMEISKSHKKERKQTAIKLLKDLGLTEEEMKRKVNILSGGQQQRVAIARALASDADVILADEPTGNLDNNNAKDIINILKDLPKKQGKCVIVVTHSNQVSEMSDVVLEIDEGKLKEI